MWGGQDHLCSEGKWYKPVMWCAGRVDPLCCRREGAAAARSVPCSMATTPTATLSTSLETVDWDTWADQRAGAGALLLGSKVTPKIAFSFERWLIIFLKCQCTQFTSMLVALNVNSEPHRKRRARHQEGMTCPEDVCGDHFFGREVQILVYFHAS